MKGPSQANRSSAFVIKLLWGAPGVRRLAYEATDSGLLSPDLAAGIPRKFVERREEPGPASGGFGYQQDALAQALHVNAIAGDAKELKIAKPDVKKTPITSGEEWQIFGDPAKVREILMGKLRQTSAGKTVTRKDGTPLGLEDVEAFIAENRKETVNPSVLKTIHFDYRMSVRFFCKMALAMGNFHLGEAFSRSPRAEKLRGLLCLEDAAEFQLQGAAIWPETQSAKHVLDIIAKQDHHTLAIVDGRPLVLLISLFGQIDAVIRLGEVPETGPVTTAHGHVWRIKLPSRELRRFSMGELITEAARVRYPHPGR